ncbi:MAG: zinc ribbon domain-containing protein [Prevotella sp.]|nr:zinc ribbon domain-containing protein [Prevotella sp.]
MKCYKCNAEIPDGSKFCMECGAEQKKDKTCPKCGMAGLPEEALFCPNCGQSLKNDSGLKDKHEEANTINKEQEDNVTFPPTGDSISWFFPLYGITIGKTTMAEAKRMGYEPIGNGLTGIATSFFNKLIAPSSYIGEWSVETHGARFYKPSGKNVIANLSICTYLYGKFPAEWEKKYNISFSNSYNEWKEFMEKMRFTVFVAIAPPTNISSVPSGKLLLAVLICTSSDKKLEVRLHFNFKNNNGEKDIADSKNSLDDIFMKCLTA